MLENETSNILPEREGNGSWIDNCLRQTWEQNISIRSDLELGDWKDFCRKAYHGGNVSGAFQTHYSRYKDSPDESIESLEE